MITETGEKVKLADPRKQSVKFRNYLYKLWLEDGCIYDFDTVYEQVVYEVMGIMPSLLRSAIKRINGEKN
jgi:hypothetical protein